MYHLHGEFLVFEAVIELDGPGGLNVALKVILLHCRALPLFLFPCGSSQQSTLSELVRVSTSKYASSNPLSLILE
jgi:hypothetical protein